MTQAFITLRLSSEETGKVHNFPSSSRSRRERGHVFERMELKCVSKKIFAVAVASTVTIDGEKDVGVSSIGRNFLSVSRDQTDKLRSNGDARFISGKVDGSSEVGFVDSLSEGEMLPLVS